MIKWFVTVRLWSVLIMIFFHLFYRSIFLYRHIVLFSFLIWTFFRNKLDWLIGLDSTDRVEWGLKFLLGRKAKDPIWFLRVKPLYLTSRMLADLTRSFSLICNPHKRSFVLAPFLWKKIGTHMRTVRNSYAAEFDDILSRFFTIQECDRRTEGQTPGNYRFTHCVMRRIVTHMRVYCY